MTEIAVFWAHGESGQPVDSGPSWLDQWQETMRSSKKAMDRRHQRLDGIVGRRMHKNGTGTRTMENNGVTEPSHRPSAMKMI